MGSYGPKAKESRRTVETCPQMDIRTFQRKNVLASHSFSWEWKNGLGEVAGSIGIIVEDDGLLLAYKLDGKRKRVKVYYSITKTGYGSRKWFACPHCGERCAILYLNSGFFACRKCHDLTYVSVQTSDDLEYYHWQLEKLCKRLKAEYDPTRDYAPDKPLRMHWSTYAKLKERYAYLAEERAAAFVRIVGARWM